MPSRPCRKFDWPAYLVMLGVCIVSAVVWTIFSAYYILNPFVYTAFVLILGFAAMIGLRLFQKEGKSNGQHRNGTVDRGADGVPK